MKWRDGAAGRRAHMLREQLRRRGIGDEAVLAAMAAVPREVFLPPELKHLAYEDRAVPLGSGQTVSQPYIVAAMSEALRARPGDRILEVGTGSGYQAAVLASMDLEVYTVERLPELAEEARRRLDELGIDDVHLRVGDGTLGWPEEAPFQGVIVTAAAPEAPGPLLDQLDPEGGRLVIPVGSRDLQDLVAYERSGTEVTREVLMGCRFVPLLGEEGWAT